MFLLLLSSLLTLSSCLSRQYHFVDTPLSWTEAQTYCRQNYTDLATLDNTNDTNSLMAAVNSSYYSKAWIGLYDDVLNSWRWHYDDNAFYGAGQRDYRNWRKTSNPITNEPNNFGGNEMCAEMLPTGEWNDLSCQYQLDFVCYNKSTNSPVLVTLNMNASEARQYCLEFYTDLVSIRNATENQMIYTLTEGREAWIGLYRTRTWSDQSNSTYTNWQPGQPDNAGLVQHCTAVSNSSLWSDENCNDTLPFFCYSESSLTPAYENVIALRVTFTSGENLTDSDIESLMQQLLAQPVKLQVKSVKKTPIF